MMLHWTQCMDEDLQQLFYMDIVEHGIIPIADLAIICWSELSWTDEILRDLGLDVSHRFWDDRNLFIITTYLGTILRRYSAFFSVENKDLVIVHPRTLYFMTGRHIEPGL